MATLRLPPTPANWRRSSSGRNVAPRGRRRYRGASALTKNLRAMQYRAIGRWGMRVSTVGLGSWLTYGGSVKKPRRAHVCIALTNWASRSSTRQTCMAAAVLRKSSGAPSKISRAIRSCSLRKCFSDGPRSERQRSFAQHIRMQIDASLRRLDVEYVDLYQCHRYDENTPLEETCDAMNDLVRSGKIVYWGVSEWTPTRSRRRARSRAKTAGPFRSAISRSTARFGATCSATYTCRVRMLRERDTSLSPLAQIHGTSIRRAARCAKARCTAADC